ncbi:MAG TPA: DUF983 domain-containing protein [Acetobacteraceae bacterium]|jgi:uncharacterized protein (DUF983 family)|nr:DUF983 domain-containing protein [Acetobacteraceae bacterium]
MALTVWQPNRSAAQPAWPVPPLLPAIARGLFGHCPACGEARAFRGFLKIVPTCPACAAPLGSARADDAPPYFTILVVGHIVVPSMLLLERAQNPPDWEVAAIFLPLTAILCVALLRPIKGGVLGAMVSLGMLKQPDPAA